MSLKVLGVGLSKTGTTSLNRALELLGLKSVHFGTRLFDVLNGTDDHPDFRRYDDVDAVTDLPEAWFYREILAAYTNCKAILTVREVDSWWRSVSHHFNIVFPVRPPEDAHRKCTVEEARMNDFRRCLRNNVYGSVVAHEFLYKRRFLEHMDRVRADIPPDRLLVMDITRGDGWETLCPFLGAKEPPIAFPYEGRADLLAG